MKQKEVLLALSWYNHRINEGVASYARDAGWFLNCCYIHQSILPEDWKGDGIITLLGGDPELTDFVNLHKSRVPIVDLTDSHTDSKIAKVLDDNKAIGKLGADHFAKRKFQNVGFFRTHDSWSAKLRQQGFYSQAKVNNAKIIDLDFIAHNPDSKNNFNAQQNWLAKKLRSLSEPIGVMASNDEQAVMVMLSAKKAKRKIPSDVAVLGVDDDLFAGELAPIPLSSVKTDPFKQGKLAAQLLDKMIIRKSRSTKNSKPIILTPTSIVVRKSTDTFAVTNTQVSSALDFIRDNYLKQISVSDVADRIAMSRRRLHDLFMTHTSKSVHDHIVDRKIDRAKKLLNSTDLPIKAIARKSGFSSSEHLCKTFARKLGITPGNFRNQTNS